MLNCFSRVWLFATPWTVAHQAPVSMGFSRHEYWAGLPCPPPCPSWPRDGTRILCLLHWQVGSLPLSPPGKHKNRQPLIIIFPPLTPPPTLLFDSISPLVFVVSGVKPNLSALHYPTAEVPTSTATVLKTVSCFLHQVSLRSIVLFHLYYRIYFIMKCIFIL